MNKARETILRLLSEGKITIEEAEELLDAMTAERVGDPFGREPRKPQSVGFSHEKKAHSQDMQFDFHFPWDEPDWKWPWEEEGWHWPWEPSSENEGSGNRIFFHVEENSKLSIESGDGNLSIQLGDDDELVYVNGDDEEIESTFSDDRMTRYIKLGDTNANIVIPRRISSVEISKDDGDISITELSANIALNTGDGNISLSRMNGRIALSKGDGNLMLNDVNSDGVAIKSGDGNIMLHNIIAKGVAVKMDDGMVSMDMANAVTEGSFAINAGDGRIALSLPADSHFLITANAEEGIIQHNLKEYKEFASAQIQYNANNDGSSLVATINGGGAEFALSLDTGEINIQVR